MGKSNMGQGIEFNVESDRVVAVTAGEIDGWPLDPSRYDRDGKLKEEDKQPGNNGGVDIGLDIRGMVPGGITGGRVEHVPVDLPGYLNIP